MMKVVTAGEMARIINRDITLRRLSEEDLALSVAMSLEDSIVHDNPQRVLIMCGKGVNGDYGLMAAHLLSAHSSMEVKVASNSIQGHRYHLMLLDDNVEILRSQRAILKETEETDYIVDCIYGCQDEMAVEYPYDHWISWINGSKAHVLSCDVPSGLNCDTGTLKGQEAVKADETVVLQLMKPGFYLYPGYEYAGKITLSNVGLSYDSISANETVMKTNSSRDIARMLPNRFVHSHKGTYGKVLLIAGSSSTPGAALLCATAVLKTGAGLLTVMSYRDVLNLVNSNLYEAMSLVIDEDHLRDQLDAVNLEKYTMIVIGPGLGVNKRTEILLEFALKSQLPCIIDADGLYYLKNHLDLLEERKAMTVITPHEVEYDRIFGFDRENLLEDLKRLTSEYSCLTIVFKGEHTLIASGGTITINTTGNNTLAKGGSGDVLTGIIGGFMAQSCCLESVTAAVYVHSLAADRWAATQTPYSMLASDIIEHVDEVIREITEAGQ